jgi:hypothetical protein
MTKKILQIDDYDLVELWANGRCQLRLRWNRECEMIDYIVFGKLSIDCEKKEAPLQTPGIIKALEEEDLLT